MAKRLQHCKAALAFLFVTSLANAQVNQLDSLLLDEVEVNGKPVKKDIGRLQEIQGTTIFSGKKNEVIRPGGMDADLSTNNSRQVFAKVPGVTIWENDGSGIQVGISTRGLSPNRSWEFNVRQNGYDISSEVFGYPEAYFSPPMEALDRIEIVRGAASLQFGPQFGGLLNYEIKKGATNKACAVESQQTFGSYGLFNSYNAVGGTIKKINYYAYIHHRSADGWRENSRYRTTTGYANINYNITSRFKLGLQYTRMYYVSQQPGGLTDSLFNADAQQSLRERNWFSTPWNVSSFTMDYEFNQDMKISLKAFSTIAERNSVGFMKGINVADTFNTSINSYNKRQIDRDSYNNYGTELRFLASYKLLNQKSTFATGLRAYRGNMKRRQSGTGTGGSDFDLTLTNPLYGKELNYTTDNYAVFAENLFKFGKRLSITPGARFEMVKSAVSGYLNTTSTGTLRDDSRTRNIFLLGIGSEFITSATTNVYANFSQSFRPVTFSELTPSGTTEVIDENLKDAGGYNADFGFRGKIKNYLSFDIGGFYLKYNNRIGTITQNNAPFRTNIGTSVSTGIESFVEVDPIKMFMPDSKIGFIRLFISYSYVDARYTTWNNPAIENDPLKSVEGKQLEYAPMNIARYGATYSIKQFSMTFQGNSVSEVFTDATNTEKPNAAATTGKLSAYKVMDLSASYTAKNKVNFKCGVNNLLDERYATRRAGGYPGPGLMPANGRTFYMTVGVKI